MMTTEGEDLHGVWRYSLLRFPRSRSLLQVHIVQIEPKLIKPSKSCKD